MSLTNIVYTPVDTGTAKLSPNVENTKVKYFLFVDRQLDLRLSCSCDAPFRVPNPDQLIRFKYMTIGIPSIVFFMTNSILLILTNSNIHGSFSVVAVKVFVL